MQVGVETFPAVLGHFVELLQTCDFYAIDEEMTGIALPEAGESITNSAEECYVNKRGAAGRYAMIQVGICLFHKQSASATAGAEGGSATVRYTARPFNFRLFPSSTDDASAEERVKDVVVSPAALSFLRKHGMDFQAWVYEGITFCNAAQETALRARLDAEDDAAGARDDANEAPLFTDAESAWVEKALAEAAALQARAIAADDDDVAHAGGGQARGETTHVAAGTGSEGVAREVLLPAQQSRLARDYLAQELRRRMPRVLLGRAARQGGDGRLLLTALSKEELMRRAAAEALRRRRALADVVGFRLLFNALVASRKPCVGHNCFADLLFLMDALDGPLPASLPQWKARVRQLFPRLYDTRYLATRRDLFASGRFPQMYLGGLFNVYGGLQSERVRVELPLGFEAYDPLTLLGRQAKYGGSQSKGDAAHEAGYDALMTGVVLLNLLSELGYDDLAAVPASLSDKIAIYRCLYAADLSRDEGDEYTVDDVLDLQHEAHMTTPQLTSCLNMVDVQDATLYSVDQQRTLAVLRRGVDGASAMAKLNDRFASHIKAQLYIPPHQKTSAIGMKSPSGVGLSGSATGALFSCTTTNLMRHVLRR